MISLSAGLLTFGWHFHRPFRYSTDRSVLNRLHSIVLAIVIIDWTRFARVVRRGYDAGSHVLC